MPEIIRPLPVAEEAEKLVLGAALTDAEAMPVLLELLLAEDFGIAKHRWIFEAMQQIHTAGRHISISSVWLELSPQLQPAVTLSYISDLGYTPHLADLDHYCRLIKNASIRREVIVQATQLIDACYRGDDAALEDAEKIREILAKSKPRVQARDIDQIIEDEGGINAFLGPQIERAIRLPWSKIDNVLDGLRGQMLTILGARPAIGKTAFAFQVGEAAAAQGFTTLFVSLEMGARRLLHRSIASHARVSSYNFRHGKLTEREREFVYQGLMELTQYGKKLLYTDDAGMTVQGLEALLRMLQARGNPVKLVIVDYLQLLNTVGKYENRTQQVSFVSRQLKQIAMKFDLAILALSQLSRQQGKITDEPQLDWLRESGSIEQDADQVMFLWPGSDNTELSVRPVKWKIAKNRDGALSKGVIDFDSRYCTFEGSQI